MLDSVAFLHHHFQHHSKPAFLSCLPFQNLMLFLCCCKPFCTTFFIYICIHFILDFLTSENVTWCLSFNHCEHTSLIQVVLLLVK